MPKSNRTPSQNIEAEMSVVGAVLLDNKALFSVQNALSDVDFYHPANRLIFSAIVSLAGKNKPIDLVTLSSELKTQGNFEKAGGATYLATLVDYVPTAANVSYYCKLVKEASRSRTCQELCIRNLDVSYDPSIKIEQKTDLIEEEIFRFRSDIRPNVGDVKHLSDSLVDAKEEYEKRSESKGRATGVRSGFIDCDKKTSGFQPSDLIVLAGRPSTGKTALALNFIIGSGVKVLFFSIEMSTQQLIDRLVSSISRVDLSNIRRGYSGDEERSKIQGALQDLRQWDILIDDTPALSISSIRSRAKREHAKSPLGLIVIDYLQLVSAKAENRLQEVSAVSRGLKALAKELNVPVIALSQLSRKLEERNDKRPILSDLRESGQIEQDADVVMFIHREAAYCQRCKSLNRDCGKDHFRDAELIIAKQRNGPLGVVKLDWYPQIGTFFPRANEYEQASRGL